MATGDRGKKGSSPPPRLSLLTNDIVPGERASEIVARVRQMKTRNARQFFIPSTGRVVRVRCDLVWIDCSF